MHHAATNIIGRDGDIDLMPFWAVVPSDLEVIDILLSITNMQQLSL